MGQMVSGAARSAVSPRNGRQNRTLAAEPLLAFVRWGDGENSRQFLAFYVFFVPIKTNKGLDPYE